MDSVLMRGDFESTVNVLPVLVQNVVNCECFITYFILNFNINLRRNFHEAVKFFNNLIFENAYISDKNISVI